VSFGTSFDSKQPKLEPKLFSALSETKRLFGLFPFYTETESFAVDQPKQFDREHILLFFTENLGFFQFFGFSFFFVFFCLFRNSLFWLFRFYTETESFHFRLNRNKQKTHPISLKESIFGYFSENLELFQFVSVCFGSLRNSSVCFEIFCFEFHELKQTRNRSCFGLFIFVCFEDTLVL
jgi:hypothetical protein